MTAHTLSFWRVSRAPSGHWKPPTSPSPTPETKPSQLLKFVYLTSQLRDSLVVHRTLQRKIRDPPLLKTQYKCIWLTQSAVKCVPSSDSRRAFNSDWMTKRPAWGFEFITWRDKSRGNEKFKKMRTTLDTQNGFVVVPLQFLISRTSTIYRTPSCSCDSILRKQQGCSSCLRNSTRG